MWTPVAIAPLAVTAMVPAHELNPLQLTPAQQAQKTTKPDMWETVTVHPAR